MEERRECQDSPSALFLYTPCFAESGNTGKKVKKIEKKACVSGNVCYSETEGKEEYSRRRVRSSAAERRVERQMQKPETFSGNAQEAIMENPPESKARKGRKDNKS